MACAPPAIGVACIDQEEMGDVPKVSKDSASQGAHHGPVVDLSEELAGYTANFVTFREDSDATPLLGGLPGDQCHCPHGAS
jgi:hypothetical protein